MSDAVMVSFEVTTDVTCDVGAVGSDVVGMFSY